MGGKRTWNICKTIKVKKIALAKSWNHHRQRELGRTVKITNFDPENLKEQKSLSNKQTVKMILQSDNNHQSSLMLNCNKTIPDTAYYVKNQLLNYLTSSSRLNKTNK